MEISKDIGDLIDRYWQIAYAEGRENRQHDTEAGDAQECRRQINEAIAALRAEPCEPVDIEEVKRLRDALADILPMAEEKWANPDEIKEIRDARALLSKIEGGEDGK